MMTDLFDREGRVDVVPSAFRSVGSERPPRARLPIWRNDRRLTPSQNLEEGPSRLSMGRSWKDPARRGNWRGQREGYTNIGRDASETGGFRANNHSGRAAGLVP